ncbi:MAG: hypothetical protein AAGC53_09610 [Actinomycetota bacterium]
METAFLVGLIAIAAATALSGVGGAVGGEDIETANDALGEEHVAVNPGSDASTTAGNGALSAGTGAGGSSGALGYAIEGITQTGLGGGFSSDRTVGGYWNTHFAGQTIGGEWDVVSGSVDAHLDHNGAFDMSVDGQFLDLNGHGAGHIRRTVDVIPNAHYNLSIDIGENTAGGPAVKQMEIIWNGQVVSTLDVDVPNGEVETFTVRLPPSAAAEGVLEFRSLLPSAHGPVLDNPTFTYIPDPISA